MQPLTPRQRMLAAYLGQTGDRVPVAPEFWCYIPARVLGISMIDLELEVPHWQALQQTFTHYGSEGWGIVAPSSPQGIPDKYLRQQKWVDEENLEETLTIGIAGRSLRSRKIFNKREPSWLVERYIKDFDLDWPAYLRLALIPPDELDWNSAQKALDVVGEDYLLEVYIGEGFVDFAGGQRQGGFEQVIQDLVDRPSEMANLQQRYIDYMKEKTRAAFRHTRTRSLFIGSTWSSLSLLSPALWRRWDRPVLEAITLTAHECGGLVHHHFHGRCHKVLQDLASLGLDCICPFERPPGGDITDLHEVARLLSGITTFNGNVHTVATLIDGRPEDVRREVLEILSAFEGNNRLIIGTGDQVGFETPDENIQSMIETAHQYGGW